MSGTCRSGIGWTGLQNKGLQTVRRGAGRERARRAWQLAASMPATPTSAYSCGAATGSPSGPHAAAAAPPNADPSAAPARARRSLGRGVAGTRRRRLRVGCPRPSPTLPRQRTNENAGRVDAADEARAAAHGGGRDLRRDDLEQQQRRVVSRSRVQDGVHVACARRGAALGSPPGHRVGIAAAGSGARDRGRFGGERLPKPW